jgi:hypothetical protein
VQVQGAAVQGQGASWRQGELAKQLEEVPWEGGREQRPEVGDDSDVGAVI